MEFEPITSSPCGVTLGLMAGSFIRLPGLGTTLVDLGPLGIPDSLLSLNSGLELRTLFKPGADQADVFIIPGSSLNTISLLKLLVIKGILALGLTSWVDPSSFRLKGLD